MTIYVCQIIKNNKDEVAGNKARSGFCRAE